MADPDIPLPARAYLPGVTPRPAEGSYDALRNTVRPGMTPAQLARTRAWRAGLAFYHAGFCWEAHEVLEPVWMALPEGTPERALARALIQLANAGLKARLGWPRAVARLCALARKDLDAACVGGEVVMGVALDDVSGWLSVLEAEAGE